MAATLAFTIMEAVVSVGWIESKNSYSDLLAQSVESELQRGPVSSNPVPQQPLLVTVIPTNKQKWD